MMKLANAEPEWEPPARIDYAEVVETSGAVLARPDIPTRTVEDIFRVEALGLEWDHGVMIHEPSDPAQAARGADGKKIGVFLVHGGSGDFKSMEPMAKTYARKFGYKAVSMTLPGRLYLDDSSRDWPSDTIRSDGTVRTPIWKIGEHITPDQYEIVRDDTMRQRYGIRTVARSKPGSTFYHRMAGWLYAFEHAAKDAMRRHFPEAEYSIYLSGHSTGGPHVFMMSQRVPNVAGVIAVENSPFGFVQEQQHNWSGALGKVAGYERVASKRKPRTDAFNDLYIRTWRDRARYAGPEALGQEGPNALMRLPWLMEEVLEWWETAKARAQFKAEYILTHNIQPSLTAAALASAQRLGLSERDTAELVRRYQGYPYPLTGEGAKAVPPVLFAIAKNSRDHSPEVYQEVILPLFAKMQPPPKTRLAQFGAGVHTYSRAEKDLPVGIVPAVAKLFDDAIKSGYFLA